MLGFGGAAVPRRTTLQSRDQIVVQITHMQIPSHRALHEIIDIAAILVKNLHRPQSASLR
jgi:hypothetical protein